MSDPDIFERAVENLPEICSYKNAVVEVTDTAALVQKWLDVHMHDYTAADVVAMTALVLQREQGK